jgi:hypothetical protein
VLTEEHLRLIRETVTEGPSEHEVRMRLQTLDDPEHSLDPAILAFGFHFIAEAESEARDRRGGPWGPMIELADGRQFPPPLGDIGEDGMTAWQQMLDAIDLPAVQARCGDLLWVRRHGDEPHLAARAAVRGYLALAENDDWRAMERTEGLGRALELARELGDEGLLIEVAGALSAAAEREMASEEDRPGVTLRLLQPLAALPEKLRPDELRDQLVAAEQRYGADPYIAQALGESMAQISPLEQRQEINRRTVRRWIEEAGRGDAIMRVIRLQQALELALASALKEEAEEVRVLMGGVEEKDLDLKTVAAEISLPREPIDALGEELRGLDLPEALRAFGAQGPPTGDPTEAERAASEALRETPLLALIPRVVLGEVYPTPVFKADTPDRRQRVEVAEYRGRFARLWGVVAASVLDSMFDGRRPSKEDLEAALTTPLLAPPIRERIARAFELYLEREYDECVHVLTPRLEAALRGVAASAGVPVTTPPRGEEPGGVVTLGALLNGLEGRFDEGWRQYLTTVLTDPLALNLRNAVSHGTRDAFGRFDAALLLHIACVILDLEVERPSSEPA